MTRERDMASPPTTIGADSAWIAGSLSGLAFGEILQVLGSSLRTGLLTVEVAPDSPGAQRKTVWLRDGQVVFAASTDPADHLGALLWRRGLVQLADVDRVAPIVASGRMLGQVLVDEKLLTAGSLYGALVEQVREIVLGAFLERNGVFVFQQRDELDPEANAVHLPERTRDLLAAGARRVAEVERLASAVPDPDAPLAAPAGPPPRLEGRAARLLAFVDGARSAREAFRASGLGFYEGMRVLASLTRAGIVAGAPAAPPARPAASEDPVTEPLETYRRIFKRVFFRLSHATPGASERINSWFDRLSEPERAVFDGVRMSPEGEVDVARVLVNVFTSGRAEGPAARARALAALDEFLSFALFEAKNVLPREDGESLAREVARMQGRRVR